MRSSKCCARCHTLTPGTGPGWQKDADQPWSSIWSCRRPSPLLRAWLKEEVAALPAPEKGDSRRARPRWQSVDPALIEQMVSDHVGRAMGGLPPGPKGDRASPARRKDGKDADLEVLNLLIEEAVTKTASSLLTPSPPTIDYAAVSAEVKELVMARCRAGAGPVWP